MKLPIKIKRNKEHKVFLPQVIDKGDWIDLRVRTKEEINLKKGDTMLLDLGVVIKVPKGYEVIIAPRSSSFKNFGVIVTNSIGIIDNVYSSNEDYIKTQVHKLTSKAQPINHNDRIAQFRVQLSQKATMWQKIKHLFYSGVKIIEVDYTHNNVRGGYGTTGVN